MSCCIFKDVSFVHSFSSIQPNLLICESTPQRFICIRLYSKHGSGHELQQYDTKNTEIRDIPSKTFPSSKRWEIDRFTITIALCIFHSVYIHGQFTAIICQRDHIPTIGAKNVYSIQYFHLDLPTVRRLISIHFLPNHPAYLRALFVSEVETTPDELYDAALEE